MRCVWCGLQKWSMMHTILDCILQRSGMTKTLLVSTSSHRMLSTLLSIARPDDQHCSEAQEFDLVWNILIAAVEERYKDAVTNFSRCGQRKRTQCSRPSPLYMKQPQMGAQFILLGLDGV